MRDRFKAVWPSRLKKEGFCPLAQFLRLFINGRILVSCRRSQEDLDYGDLRLAEFLKKEGASSLQIETPDGKILDGCTLEGGKRPWLVYLNASAELYEDLFTMAERYFEDASVNVLLFNYRGCGRSQGPLSPLGVALDVDSVLQYLESRGVAADQIVLVGRSFGGGIGVETAAIRGHAVCNDRSFARLKDQVRMMFGGGAIGRLAAFLVEYSGWSYDTISYWRKIPKDKKWALYHLEDRVVDYLNAALHPHLQPNEKSITLHSRWAYRKDGSVKKRVRLEELESFEHPHRKIEAHNQPLYWDENAWRAHISILGEVLD